MHDVSVAVIIRYRGGIILVRQEAGWVLPGGGVNEGESLEQAAYRMAEENSGLGLCALRQFHTYSGERYPGCSTITAVFIADGKGELRAGGTPEARVAHIDKLPPLSYDHAKILMDYQNGEFEGLD